MNRKEEYAKLISDLEQTPPRLEFSVQRAKARAKRVRRGIRFFAVPAGSVVTFLIAFTLTVNLSMAFAMACGRVPLLRELAAAVAFSPSLSAAVENEYVQPMGLEETVNGVTMRIEYVIVDQKQLNIFYSLKSGEFDNFNIQADFLYADGSGINESILQYGYESDQKLQRLTLDFHENTMPDTLIFKCGVYTFESAYRSEPARPYDGLQDNGDAPAPGIAAEFSFTLNFDPAHTAQGETITLNQSFILDGQRLTATTAEIYPTHIRLNLIDDKNNTAWLQSLMFYAENEKGERFTPVGNGITATGSVDSPMMASHRLESSFFSKSESLTLYITGVEWLDKDMERVEVNLAEGRADALPQGVALEEAVFARGGWQLTFSAERRMENSLYSVFHSRYYDADGNEYPINTMSMINAYYNEDGSEHRGEDSPRFDIKFTLSGYTGDRVWLSPVFSRSAVLEAPVELRIK